jgi:hypothetical protein
MVPFTCLLNDFGILLYYEYWQSLFMHLHNYADRSSTYIHELFLHLTGREDK